MKCVIICQKHYLAGCYPSSWSHDIGSGDPVFVFYERHWDTVTRYMASSLASEITLLVDEIAATDNDESLENALKKGRVVCFSAAYERQAILEPPPQFILPAMQKMSLQERCHHASAILGRWILYQT